MKEPTDIQLRVFEFVREKLATGRPAPTSREIALAFGWSGKRAAECHIQALLRKGWLASDPGKARSLRLGPVTQPGLHTIVEIPILGSVPAGLAADRQQDSEERIPVTVESIGFKPSRHTFALRVSGHSMVGRHICDGDLVLLEHGPQPHPGQIVVALVDRQSTLKTFVIRNGKPFLMAENSNYPDLIPSDELIIQGVFRGLIRKARE